LKSIRTLSVVVLLLMACVPARTQGVRVAARIQLYMDHNASPEKNNRDVAVWLEPSNPMALPQMPQHNADHFAVVQQGHAFAPHVLIVPVGANVEFPNRDLIFHNAFSLFEGKRFDLGLYESGASKRVRFDRPGIAYVFCNIHYDMSAIIIALSTPYYGLTDRKGMVKITGVPPGRYRLRVWAEGASAETLSQLTRELRIEQDSFIGNLRIETAPAVTMAHTNKYGLPYDSHTNEELYGH
jgi:plastocyanin